MAHGFQFVQDLAVVLVVNKPAASAADSLADSKEAVTSATFLEISLEVAVDVAHVEDKIFKHKPLSRSAILSMAVR